MSGELRAFALNISAKMNRFRNPWQFTSTIQEVQSQLNIVPGKLFCFGTVNSYTTVFLHREIEKGLHLNLHVLCISK